MSLGSQSLGGATENYSSPLIPAPLQFAHGHTEALDSAGY